MVMCLENPPQPPENAVKTENEFEDIFPIRMVRDASGTLILTWDRSDSDDPRPSYWETILMGEDGSSTVTAISHFVAIDPDRPAVWKEVSVHLSPNKHRTSYEARDINQQYFPSKKIYPLLQALRRGVELYTTFKELTVEQQKEYAYIEDKFPVDYVEDEAWKKITYMYGIRKNPIFEIVTDD